MSASEAVADSLSESFVLVQTPPPVSEDSKSPSSTSASNLDEQIRLLTKILDLVTDRTQLDHPLCQNCAQAATADLERKLQVWKIFSAEIFSAGFFWLKFDIFES